MEVIIEGFIQFFLLVACGVVFVLAVICLIKIDEDVKITDKESCIAGLFFLPVIEIIFVLDIVRDILIVDLELIPMEIIFVILIGIETYLMAKTVRR